jgi:ribosomal protein L21E
VKGLTSTGQLNLFEQINAAPSALAPETPALDDCPRGRFAVGDCIQIAKTGAPFEHLNGQKGIVVGLMADAVSVQVEGIAVALIFRREALEKWTPIHNYTSTSAETESVILFRVGDRVEGHVAFLGQVGIVKKVGMHCAMSVAWVDYGNEKPLYPCALEHLTHSES